MDDEQFESFPGYLLLLNCHQLSDTMTRITSQQAADYVTDSYELTADDVRDLRNQVAQRRKIYEDRYRDVRHMVFAHKRRDATVEAVLTKTNIEELKDFFGFLPGLYAALDRLYINGREPVVQIWKLTLPPNRRSGLSPGERVYAQGHEVLRMVSLPDPEEERYNAGALT